MGLQSPVVDWDVPCGSWAAAEYTRSAANSKLNFRLTVSPRCIVVSVNYWAVVSIRTLSRCSIEDHGIGLIVVALLDDAPHAAYLSSYRSRSALHNNRRRRHRHFDY